MIKCVECGKEIKEGGPRYATPIGSFCQECWDKKDPKFKDNMLKRALYGLRSMAGAILDMKKGGKR
nr:MAG TPA: NMD3 family [Caudoviricetes sp.]